VTPSAAKEGVAVHGAATPPPPPRRPFPLGPCVAGAVLLAAGGVLLWSAAGAAAADGADRSLRGPWIAPLAVSTAWVALSVAYLVRQLVGWPKAPAVSGQEAVAEQPAAGEGAGVATGDPTVPDGDAEGDRDDHVRWGALALHIAAIVGFAMLLKPLGFIVAGAAFMIVSIKIFGSRWPRHLLRDLLVAALLPLAIHLVVKELLGINLTQGVLHLNLRQGELYLLPPMWEWPW
jgi:putative tricarboxylic transport membrane protein